MSSGILENNLGKFSIDMEVINMKPDIVRQIMSLMIIVRAEKIHYNDTIEYQAICPLFRPLKLGDCLPDYTIIIGDGQVKFEEVKR